MRIRTVKPEFWDDESLALMSRDARLLFIATFNIADDEGLLRWTPAYLKAEAFKYDDDLGASDVGALAGEIVSSGMVVPYQVGSQKLGWLVNFHKHQRVNRPQPSKMPAPSLQNATIAQRYAERDSWTCTLCGGPVNRERFYLIDPYAANGPPDLSSLNPSLDHKTPRVAGGSDHPSNIALAHIGCNKSRGSRPIAGFTPPDSVVRAMNHVLTSENADSVIEIGSFTESSMSDRGGDAAPSLLEGEREGEEEGEKTSSSTVADATPDPQIREDVEAVCSYMVARVVGNGVKAPTITKAWRDAARLLIDKDGHTVDQIMWLIDWATADEFWKSNILSLPKLREKFDQLRIKATGNSATKAPQSPVVDAWRFR